MKFYKKIFLVLSLFSIFQNINAKEIFVIDDIVLKGLQRVDSGSIYSYLPFEVGDTFDTSMTPSVIKTLFKSKFFKSINCSVVTKFIIINNLYWREIFII